MDSWKALAPSPLKPLGEISASFIDRGIRHFQSAAEFVNGLPFGRNAACADKMAVLREGRGTCSTKHALLRRLALEQNLEINLVLGIYVMSEQNTPGVGDVLAKYGLTALPEAHCYLRSGKRRIDVTRVTERDAVERIAQFLHEETISPDQIGEYKADVHRKFLEKWVASSDLNVTYTLEELWTIREECIAALTQNRSTPAV